MSTGLDNSPSSAHPVIRPHPSGASARRSVSGGTLTHYCPVLAGFYLLQGTRCPWTHRRLGTQRHPRHRALSKQRSVNLAPHFLILDRRRIPKLFTPTQPSEIHRFPFRTDERFVDLTSWTFCAGRVGEKDTISGLHGSDGAANCPGGI